MRTHHVLAIAAVILIGFGVKLFFFSAQPAEANIHAIQKVSVPQMQIDYPNIKNLPVQKMHDMTFVFSDGD